MRRPKPRAFPRSCRLWPLTVSLALAAPAAAAADPKPFEDILPEGTSVFLSVRSLPQILEWYRTSAASGLAEDPDMQPFLRKAAEAFDVLMAEMKKETGFTLADLKEASTGEVALAIGDPNEFLAVKEKGGDGPVLLLVEARGTKDKVRDILKKGLEKVERRKREIDFRGQTIIALEPREAEKDKVKEPGIYIAHAEDLLAVSLSRNILQDTLASRSDAPAKPLSQAADFKELRARHGKDAAFFAYANTGRWIDKLPALVPADETPPEQVAKVFEVLGLSRIRGIGAAQTLAADGGKTTYFLLAPSGPGGLLGFIWTKPRALSFPTLIPDDATSAWVAQVDFGALWKTIEDTVRTFAPGGGEGEDPIKMMETNLGLNLKDDLIAPLGGQVSYFERAAKQKSVLPEFAVLAEIKDREKLQATLEKLLAMVPLFQKSEYLGRNVWTLGLPGQPPGEEGGLPAISLSVMDTHFVVAASRPIVEEVLRRVGKEVKSIKDTSDFKALGGLFPPSATFIGYESPQSLADTIDEVKKSLLELKEAAEEAEKDDGEEPAADKKAAGFEERMLKLWLEMVEALPEGKVIAKHFGGAVMWSFAEERILGLTQQIILRKKK
jgi:hypothetical protein